jgi:hypothetical protein
MLTEKDYCDYDTCVALKELGYKVPTSAYYMPNNNKLIFVSNPFRGGYVIDCFRSQNSFPKDVMTSDYIDAPTMWEAQKWLREEKEIEVVVLSKGMVGSPYYYQVYTEDYVVDYNEEYNSYEEALSEGVCKATEILKILKEE